MKKHWNKEEREVHYEPGDKNDKLILNFRDINHTMRSLYEGKGSQKRILIILLETGTITQQKLTERLGIRPGSASEVLAKLEKSGLIVRRSSAQDRRTADVSLTEEGRILAGEAVMQRKKRHEEMFSCLAEEEKAVLLALLEKINASWEERYQSVNRRTCGQEGRKQHHRKKERE